MRVTLRLRRKMKRISIAKTTPTMIASRTLAAEETISSLWSYQLAILTPRGSWLEFGELGFDLLGNLDRVAAGLLIDLKNHRVVAVGGHAHPLRSGAFTDRRDILQ